MPITKSACHLVLLTNWLHIRASHYSLLRFILLKKLTEFRTAVYSLDYWFITKDMNRQPDEEIHRARYVKGTWASLPFQHAPFPTSPFFWFPWRVYYIGKDDWIMGARQLNSISSAPPLSQVRVGMGGGEDWKCQHSNHAEFSWHPAPSLRWP